MKSKHFYYLTALLITTIALGGCARIPIEDGPSPEAIVQAGFAAEPLATGGTTPSGMLRDVTEATESASPELATVTEAAESASLEQTQVTVRRPDDPIVIVQMERTDVEFSYDDSVSYLAMIRPDDYLGKIAMREYNDPDKWSRIYQWNRQLIGDDPNSIHPYQELELFKPEQEITSWSYDYLIHTVAQGETLWAIARDWYGDNLAWVIIFADNEELFASSRGHLTLGMELKIRTTLIGPQSDEQRVSNLAIP